MPQIPNLYIWLLMFYCFFHLWLNILAELLRFGDRAFYKDWWNAESLGTVSFQSYTLCMHINMHVRVRMSVSVQAFTQRRFLLADVESSRPQLGDALHLHSDAATRLAEAQRRERRVLLLGSIS